MRGGKAAGLAALAALTALFCASCFNGKREADDICVFLFSAVQSPASTSAGTVALVKNDSKSSQQTVALDLVVYGPLASPVYGMAFHLAYEADTLSLVTSTTGAVLTESGAVSTGMRAKGLETDHIVFGLTRLEPAKGGVSLASGANVMATLFFTPKAAGDTTLQFVSSTGVVADASGAAISGISWSATTTLSSYQECFK